MLLPRQALPLLLVLALASPAGAQAPASKGPAPQGLGSLAPLGPLDSGPDHVRRYSECMTLARSEPLKALPVAEKWHGEGGGLAARHCVAVAMFEAGRYGQAAAQFEAIARDMGSDRPGLRAELWGQAGQAFIEAGAADKAAEAQSRAIDLKGNDPDLWVDRGLSYAAMRAWPRAISDFDRALILRPNDVEILVLRAAAWRNAGKPSRALDDAAHALRLAPDHSEALLERGFARLVLGEQTQANNDFNRVLRLVPPDSSAARRAQAGLHGEPPVPPAADAPAPPPVAPKGGGKR
jgi:tetratricopeptide (TPR) repeat protein